jgi:hypothetical protein
VVPTMRAQRAKGAVSIPTAPQPGPILTDHVGCITATRFNPSLRQQAVAMEELRDEFRGICQAASRRYRLKLPRTGASHGTARRHGRPERDESDCHAQTGSTPGAGERKAQRVGRCSGASARIIRHTSVPGVPRTHARRVGAEVRRHRGPAMGMTHVCTRHTWEPVPPGPPPHHYGLGLDPARPWKWMRRVAPAQAGIIPQMRMRAQARHRLDVPQALRQMRHVQSGTVADAGKPADDCPDGMASATLSAVRTIPSSDAIRRHCTEGIAERCAKAAKQLTDP